MPQRKKRIFNKKNCVKYLLLPGNPTAVNAEGECLKNILVPVSNSYKPGSSLLLSNIAALCNAELPEEENKEPDLKNILDQFEDAEDASIEEIADAASKIKDITLDNNELYETASEDDGDKYEAVSDDDFFSDENPFSDDESASADRLNCSEDVKVFNARFEKIFKEEYGDDQIGALDDEEIFGYLDPDSDRVKTLLNSELSYKNEELIFGNYEEELKNKILAYVEESDDEKYVEVVTKKQLEFDCESILSTYSNIYNHPTIIKEEKVKKIKVLANPLRKRLTKAQLNTLVNEKDNGDESDDDVSVVTMLSIRPKGETPEQRRERKSLFKEAKRESRILKKENKLAFKHEKKLQKSSLLNAQRTAGIKLM